jgi:hypothetical protein
MSQTAKRITTNNSAILCERADSLKALGSVASYLENGNFLPINDKEPGALP